MAAPVVRELAVCRLSEIPAMFVGIVKYWPSARGG